MADFRYVMTDLTTKILLAFWSRNKAECFGNDFPKRSGPRCTEKQHGWRWRWKSGPHYGNKTLNKRNGGRTEACRQQEVLARGFGDRTGPDQLNGG